MNKWARDSAFYHAPVVKVLLAWTSASSFLYRILALNHAYPPLLQLLGLWALPSPGSWLAAAVVLYNSRVLERRAGSAQFVSILLSAGVVVGGVAALAHYGNHLLSLGLPPLLTSRGSALHALAGVVAVHYALSVSPDHCKRVGGVSLSSNLVLYGLVALLSLTSWDSAIAALCGMVAGLVVLRGGFVLPLPRGPGWLRLGLWRLVHVEQPPPVLSGATMTIQREQRMDQLERLMLNVYHQRPTIQVLRQPPSEQQIQQLTTMGFQRNAAYQALLRSGSNTAAAIQLLTGRQNQL